MHFCISPTLAVRDNKLSVGKFLGVFLQQTIQAHGLPQRKPLTQQGLPVAERWPIGMAEISCQSIFHMKLLAGMIIYLQKYFELRVFPLDTQYEN